MKLHWRILCAVVTVVVLLQSTCVADSSNTTFKLGNYSYSVPESWETVVSETNDKVTYHYETGSVFNGTYIMTSVIECESDINTVESCFDEFVSGILETPSLESCKEVNAFECHAVSDLPSRSLRFKLVIDDVKFNILFYVWSDWENIYSIGYSQCFVLDAFVRREFETFLSTVCRNESQPSATKVLTQDKTAALNDLADILAAEGDGNTTHYAEYIEEIDTVLFVLKSNTIERHAWDLCGPETIEAFKSTVENFSKNIKDNIDTVGYYDTHVLVIFKLNDGSIEFIAFDGIELTRRVF